MTVKIYKPDIDVRQKLKELDRPTGQGGQTLLMSESIRDAQNALGIKGKNILINSAFEVNQRNEDVTNGVTISGVNDYHTVDRWNEYNNSGVSRKVTVRRDEQLPNGKKANIYRTEFISGTSNWLHPVQKLELERWMLGQTFTMSCWVKTNIPNFKMRYCDTQHCFLVGPEIPNDGAFHYVTATITFPTEGLTLGNVVQFQPAFGSHVLSTGDYLEFAQFQVELGEQATPYEYIPYHEELLRCQRYFYKIEQSPTLDFAAMGLVLGSGSGGTFVFPLQTPVPMRSPPDASIAIQNLRLTYQFSGSSIAVTSISLGYFTNQVYTLLVQTGGTATSGNVYLIGDNGNGNGYIKIDNEF